MAADQSWDDTSDTAEARRATAAALRRFGNAFVAHELDADILRRIDEQIEGLLPAIDGAPMKANPFILHGSEALAERIRDSEPTSATTLFPDSLVSGKANPMSMDATLDRDGDEAILTVTLGPAFEGAPGRAHGGAVAAIFDEAMGLALSVSGTMAFTGRLSITYRAPAPLGELLTLRARIASRVDRKITITGELRSPDTLLAEGEALFIAVNTDHFLGDPGAAPTGAAG